MIYFECVLLSDWPKEPHECSAPAGGVDGGFRALSLLVVCFL